MDNDTPPLSARSELTELIALRMRAEQTLDGRIAEYIADMANQPAIMDAAVAVSHLAALVQRQGQALRDA